MPNTNGVQLITYADRLGDGNLSSLTALLDDAFADVFSGVHLLPFFYPIDGEDAGFDPIDHAAVDSRLGTWEDIKTLGQNKDIMADMIVNHISAKSDAFKDVLKHGENSDYWSLFLTKDSVFKEDEQALISRVFRPRPTPCFTDYTLNDGTSVPFWTTFTSNQIDIDVESEKGKDYLNNILDTFAENNVNLIRLDAAGYAIKRSGSNCFMLEETFEFIEALSEKAAKQNMQCLVEIHSHYQTQIDIAKRCDSVYDFALPPLVLHTLFSQDATALTHWLSISPRNCFTVLDTHDGIGIVDVGPSGDKAGLLNESQIDSLVETIHSNSKSESRQATGAAASNVDLYQINCTFFDALGQNEEAYLLARAIQYFCPGIPQVYYGGLLAMPNDMALLKNTNVGRDINRPYITGAGVQEALKKPVVQALLQLTKLRNASKAFDGKFEVSYKNGTLKLAWTSANAHAQLDVNMASLEARIRVSDEGRKQDFTLTELIQG